MLSKDYLVSAGLFRRIGAVSLVALAALGAWSVASLAGSPATSLSQDLATGQIPDPSGQNAGSGSGASAALGMAQSMGEQATRYWLPSLGDEAPAWLQRTEFSGKFGADGRPEYTLLTVQPLYRSDDKADTVFIQGSQLRYSLFDQDRDTTNLGIGYRRLLLDNTLLVGGNTFFDREWTYGHERVGFGADAMWRMLDFHANDYLRVTQDRDVGSGATERAMNGWDSELRSQIPFLPWAKVGLQRYVWNGQFSNVRGWAYSLDMDLTQNVSLQLLTRTAALPGTGASGGGVTGENLLATVSFHLGSASRPVAASEELISDHPFADTQDLSGHTLDKVRRENRVIVERTVKTNGISIVVGRSG